MHACANGPPLKGLFAKRRQLILTDAPRLYYIDPVAMELKGEIPWSEALKVEQKNWKTFFVHTVSTAEPALLGRLVLMTEMP